MTITFDATHDFDNVFPPVVFEWMQKMYWVCAKQGERAAWDMWCMSTTEPLPVPNQSMSWRRPTWEECFWYATFEDDDTIREISKKNIKWHVHNNRRKYARPT